MKTNILLFLIALSLHCVGQSPEKLNYQVIVRNSSGELVQNKEVSIRLSILESSPEGKSVYMETHRLKTNVNGLLSLFIGSGSTDGDFSAIEWGSASHYLKTKIDANGGTNYTQVSVTQLVSVPYALHAKTASTLLSDEVDIDYTTLSMGSDDNPHLIINDKNQMLLFTNEADTTRPDLRKDIQLAPNARMWGYSSEYHLDKSGVFNLQAVDTFSKPAIVWYSPTATRQAAIVSHIRSGGHNRLHNHWSIETTDSHGSLQTRMDFDLDKDWTQIQTSTADFKVGGSGTFEASGDLFARGDVGFGYKDWRAEGLYGTAKWEFYDSLRTADLLIHHPGTTRSARLSLKRSSDIWDISNDGVLELRHNTRTRVVVTQAGDVAIGQDAALYKLDVNGDVSVTSGHSYYSYESEYAEYFECEGELNTGDVVGINTSTGLLGKYQEGYELVGVVVHDAAIVLNNKEGRARDDDYALVSSKGQLTVDMDQVDVYARKVMTKDHKPLGILLSSGKVYMKILE